MRRAPRRNRVIAVLTACFTAGVVTGWSLRAVSAPGAPERNADEVTAGGRTAVQHTLHRENEVAAAPTAVVMPTISANVVAELRRRELDLPVDAAEAERMKGAFEERRGGGSRLHEAVDILAPRGTPVRAVEDGTVAKLFLSKAGGISVYQFDASERFTYYYAHLDRYAEGLREGQRVERGDVIGYVGTTGNAPRNTPHLHFAIFELTPQKRWWEGTPVDPYLVFRKSEPSPAP
jgi:murein DD-endopeptidase MepM/ murein hydrolase activator NlpD